jgi:hypothetical protein
VRPRHRLGVDLPAATDEDLVRRAGQRERLSERVRHLHVGVLPVAVPGDHDRPSPRQRPTDRLERQPAHDEDVAHRGPLEVREVLGQVPGNLRPVADDAVAADGGNQRDLGHRRMT